MANFSSIKQGNTTYNVADKEARAALANQGWTILGEGVMGNAEQALPSGWSELLVCIGKNVATGNRDNFSINIHSGACAIEANNFFYSGSYFSSSINNGVQIKVTGKTKIQLTTAYLNGSDNTSAMRTTVFYKK